MKIGAPEIAPPPICNTSSITDIKVYILGNASPDDTLPSQFSDVDIIIGTSRKYRLATTHFQHDSNINIRVTATFTFTHELYGGQTTTVIPYDGTFTFKAWNLLQTAGTDADWVGGNWVYSSLFNRISRETLAHIHEQSTAVNYGLDPVTINGAMDQAWSDIVTRALPSTAFMGQLHGGLDYIHDSHASGGFGHWDIQQRIQAKPTGQNPAFNLIALWSCETFDLQASGWAGAYGIGVPARAYLGFGEVIFTACWTGDEWQAAINAGYSNPFAAGIPVSSEIDDHTGFFMEHARMGVYAEEAAAIADSEIPMVNREFLGMGQYMYWKVPMNLAGDGYSRLRYIYLNGAERAAIDSLGGSIDLDLVKLPIQ